MRVVYLNRCDYPSGPYKRGREKQTLLLIIQFVMALSLCGVPGLVNDGSSTRSETTEDRGPNSLDPKKPEPLYRKQSSCGLSTQQRHARQSIAGGLDLWAQLVVV